MFKLPLISIFLPIIIFPPIRASPTTSNGYAGEVVPTPIDVPAYILVVERMIPVTSNGYAGAKFPIPTLAPYGFKTKFLHDVP